MGRANVGGPAVQAVALQRGLDPSKFDSRFVVGSVEDDEEDYIKLVAPDVEVIRLPARGRYPGLRDLHAIATLYRLMREFRPDIVHTHTAKAGVMGRLAAMAARVPARVHTFHGHLLSGYFAPPVTRSLALMERLLATRTAVLMAVGERVRDDLLAAGIGHPGQYRVVAPGIPIERFRSSQSKAEARRGLGLPMDVHVVGYAGRLVPIKRIDYLAELFTRLAEDPAVYFLVAGNGSEFVRLQAIKEGLADRLRLLGWRHDVQNVLAAADVVVNVSDNEGMPVALIEAAAAGRPSVATDAGSTREVVVDGVTGFVSAFGSEFVQRVRQILVDPDLQRSMGEAARQHAIEHFSAGRLVDDVSAAYLSICAQR